MTLRPVISAVSLMLLSVGIAASAQPVALPDAPAPQIAQTEPQAFPAPSEPPSSAGQSAPGSLPAEPHQAAPVSNPSGITTVTGTVEDTSKAAVPNATVTLIPIGHFGETTATTAADGSFSFASVPPGTYHLSVDARGLSPYTSPEFIVRSHTALTLPPIALGISTSTSINVVANPQQIALAQIHQEETQRVLGMFQNFYTSYIWGARPMPAKQKYTLAFRSLIDPPQFLIVAGIAGAEQFHGTFPGYGPGIEGYGKRYGAALADQIDSRLIGSALLPAMLHQDPRYFYQGSGSVLSRTIHAGSWTFIARGDDGHKQLNYSHILGSLAAAAISNAYHPAGSRGVGYTFENFGIITGGNVAGNIFREFLLRHLESIPSFANGKGSRPTAKP